MHGNPSNGTKMILFISGKQGSGKSTLRAGLAKMATSLGLNVSREYFAETLYDFQDAAIKWAATILGNKVPGYFETNGHQTGDRYKNGVFLQTFGDVLRGTFGEDILIKEVEKKVFSAIGYCAHNRLVIIEDGRLVGEYNAMKELAEKIGAAFVSVQLSAPEDVRKARLGDNWRPSPSHKTETGLFHEAYAELFDYRIDTSQMSPDEILAELKVELIEHFGDNSIKDWFSRIAEAFTAQLRYLEEKTSHGANFRWDYDKEGKKRLRLDDVAPMREPSVAMVAQVREELPGIIAKAEKEL